MLKSLLTPLLPSGVVPIDTIFCFVIVDSRNYWESCALFLENLFCVCVCVCAHALKRQWVTAGDVVQS